MHMIKVPGVFHDGEISTIDSSPCGSLVVTGGKDGNCNIWEMAILIEKSKITSPTTADFANLKPVSVISPPPDIEGSVTCLRFANLVENADKFIVSYSNGEVYKIGILPSGGFERKLLFKVESNSIIEISWCLDDEIVALATHGNEIIIYDLRFDEILETLIIHAEGSSLKGLKFDNSHGKWLCSLADDRLINIVSYELNWNLKTDSKKITKRIFKYENLQKINKIITNNALNANSRVRRLDWSQDDKAISIPNSNKGKMSLVNLLFNQDISTSRDASSSFSSSSPPSSGTWKNWCSLIGHNFNCEVTKFNPSIFINPNASPTDQTPLKHDVYYVIATAGSDKTLAIWNTSIDSPIIVAKDITSSTILDMCWNKNGSSLFITSISGEFLVLTFDDEELGKSQPVAKTTKPVIGVKDWGKEFDILQPRLEKIINPSSKTETPNPETAKVEDKEVPAATITKNGKKRIAPMLVSGSTINTKVDSIKKASPMVSGTNTTMEFDPPSYVVSKTISQQVKRKNDDLDEPKKKFKKELVPIEFIGSVIINPSTSFSNVRLSIPKIRKSWDFISPNDDSLYLTIKNGNGNESGPSKVQLSKKNQFSQSSEDAQREIFFDFIPKKILLSTGGEGLFWAVATIDGIIIVYSDSGKRILPPIILGTPLSFLESKGDYLMAITCLGEIYAWNIKNKTAIFEPTSLFPLLQPLIKPTLNKPNLEDDEDNEQELYENDILARAENLTLCSITSQGIPIITLSNGNGYLYDKDMRTWSLVSDSWWAFGSQYWDNTLISGGTNQNDNIISMLEKHTNEEIIRKGKNKFFNKISKIMLMKEGFENLENIISINHLENKMLIYKFLKDEKNFKYFLMIYVKKLIEMNFINRIYDLILNLKEAGGNDQIVTEIVMLNPKLNDFVKSV